METFRYAVALFAIIVYPPVVIFWLIVHPLVRYWRAVGPTLTYAVTLAVLAVIGGVLFIGRHWILAVEYGSGPLLVSLSVISLSIGLAIDVQCRQQLSIRILMGVPELRVEHEDDQLLQEGIYARVRHPRYLGSAFGLLGVSLFANYLAPYVVAVVCAPLLYVVTVLEERELVHRFGDEYVRYQRRVPRFIPRLGGS
jgi:protein-S-isoprenylcysteine O-methyltransferase Ste14